jgi:transcriptional regulator with XRE-family HTH domain
MRVSQMRSNDFTWSEVGRCMQRLRLARSFNQADLAAAAGLTKPAISILESGQTNPRISTLQQVASALTCSVRSLVCGEERREHSEHEKTVARITGILESRDLDAIQTFWSGVAASEVMINRRSMAICYPHRLHPDEQREGTV